ncbi:cytochrome P450 89A2-like [Triticum urartu]|nr:cytochrome P450 89A2-like [Triticum dicoccoides]XP_048554043.1 cytochrome P450 89A2-like [Triticum urartu]
MQQQVQQISMDQLVVLLALLLCGLLAVLRRGRAPPPPPSLAMHKIIDPAVAHRALVDNADAFSNRPPARLHVALAGRRGGQRNENLNSVAHGPHWRALRCNLTAETLHPSRLGSLAPLQREAVQGLVADLSSAPRGSREEVTEVHQHLYGAVFSVVARVCFGDAVDEAHVRAMRHVIQRFQIAIGLVKPFTSMGSVMEKLVEWRRLRRLFAIDVRLKELFLPPIQARRRGLQSARPRDDDGRRPYVDSLVDLRIPDEDGGRRALRDDEMVQLISEFLGAGTGTAVATLEWALAHLVDKPEMQEKLRGEVDNGEVSRAGAGMPYLHAVVLETLRMHPPLPVIPRHVHADAVGVLAGGMDVPPPACDFYVNFSAGDIGRDSKIWKDPDEFLPERFLTGGDGEGIGPLPGPKQIRMMPFGAGHRFCPGVGMAMVNMKCFLAALVREFEWAPPTGTIAIDLTELDSFFKVMKKPLSARVTRRTKSI